jgi:hypothetical protein
MVLDGEAFLRELQAMSDASSGGEETLFRLMEESVAKPHRAGQRDRPDAYEGAASVRIPETPGEGGFLSGVASGQGESPARRGDEPKDDDIDILLDLLRKAIEDIEVTEAQVVTPAARPGGGRGVAGRRPGLDQPCHEIMVAPDYPGHLVVVAC